MPSNKSRKIDPAQSPPPRNQYKKAAITNQRQPGTPLSRFGGDHPQGQNFEVDGAWNAFRL
jgi:hypothetical protein